MRFFFLFPGGWILWPIGQPSLDPALLPPLAPLNSDCCPTCPRLDKALLARNALSGTTVLYAQSTERSKHGGLVLGSSLNPCDSSSASYSSSLGVCSPRWLFLVPVCVTSLPPEGPGWRLARSRGHSDRLQAVDSASGGSCYIPQHTADWLNEDRGLESPSLPIPSPAAGRPRIHPPNGYSYHPPHALLCTLTVNFSYGTHMIVIVFISTRNF